MQNDNFNFLDVLAIVSVILQVKGYQNDMSQSSNDDLMKELQRQDRTYLEKIIEKQEDLAKTRRVRLIISRSGRAVCSF